MKFIQLFSKNTKLIVSSKNPRDQATYEKDTTRVEIITKSNIKELLKKMSGKKLNHADYVVQKKFLQSYKFWKNSFRKQLTFKKKN